MNKKINLVRALVVDDSAFMRRLLTDLLESSGQIKVVGIARNGIDAVAKNQRLLPDVITLDVEMPEMDGLRALTELMRTRPVPVVMLSSLTQSGARETIEALSRGAIDFVGKPSSPQEVLASELRQEIIDKVLNAAQVEVAKLTPFTPPPAVIPAISQPRPLPASGEDVRLVAIGTSTGGPRALHKVMEQLKPDGKTAYLVVQHMPKGFTRSLAERLDSISELTISEATEGPVEPDHVYIAPGDYHLNTHMIQGRPHIYLTQTAPVNGHRPAVDVLFNSLAAQPGLCRVAVILTGMGSDGAKGLA
ncbi:MAG TPA: chemotaxis response regulator protein-glutamate methylesterase, partial [Firmicutes bacterium]|nr:chemotaxis response regulator protein-glutamate methylesterase [Bacillota bacterium]